jgi:hypothetical protein
MANNTTFKSNFLAASIVLCAIVVMLQCLSMAQVSVTTYHNDLARTGQNLNEPVLTPANVNVTDFGKLFTHTLDGQVYTQPLYVPNVTIPNNGVHNVVYVATEHDSVYAFDADNNTGGNADPLWRVSFIDPPTVTTIPSSDFGDCHDLNPEIGTTGTPVIDLSTGTMYLLARTKESGNYVDRLHALDIATGAEKFGGPVEVNASVPGTGGGGNTVVFDHFTQNQRAGLVLKNGVVYMGFSLLCSAEPFYGWLLGYDAHSLTQTAVWNSTADGSHGGIWAGGSAPAVDTNGNFFLATGDGTFDAETGGSDYGSSIVKLPPPTANWAPSDYFTPFDFKYQNEQNLDLSSAGLVLMPEQPQGPHHHLLFLAGKEGTIYLVDRDQMGHFHQGKDSQIVEALPGALPGGQWGSPAWWNNYAYFSGAQDVVKSYGFNATTGLLSTTPVSESSPTDLYFNGSTPVISANQNSNAIVWTAETHIGQATMHAYDALELDNELFNTKMNPTRDGAGNGARFMVPTVANGKVYLATNFRLATYGLFTFRPSSLTFPVVLAGTISSTRTVTLTNPSIAAMNITSIAATGEFQLASGTCPISGGQLGPGASCTIGVQFAPQGGGSKSGNVNVTVAGMSVPLTVPLTGTGKSLTFTPTQMDWGAILIGQTSVPKLLTVNIFGKDPTTFNSVKIGNDSAEYAISSNTCTGSQQGPSHCSIYVTFTPNYSGPRSGTLNLSDTSGNQVINLTGTGEGIDLSAKFLGFGKVKVGTTSAPQTLSAQVLGTASATFGTASFNGANPGDYGIQSDACSGQTIPAGTGCQIKLVFKPLHSGARTANLNLPNNDGISPLVVKLSGQGQ